MTSQSTVTSPRPLLLRRNISWTFAGNVVYAGCQWALVLVLARLGSPEMIGQFGLGLAVTAPIMLFANLQLRAVQATDASGEYAFRDYLALRLVTTALALLTYAAIALGAGYRRETALVILAVGLAKGFESISDIIYGLLQQGERMDRIARLQMVKGPMLILAMGGALYLTGSIIWAVVALAASWGLRLVLYDLPSVAWIRGGAWHEDLHLHRVAPRKILTLAWLALPLGIVVLLSALYANLPRYYVERALGEAQLGFFVAMAQFTIIGQTVVIALGQAVSPRLARHYAGRDYCKFRRLAMRVLAMNLGVGVAGLALALAVGRPVLHALYGPSYAEHADTLAWLMAAAGISYPAYNSALIASRSFRAMAAAWLTAIAAMVVIFQLRSPVASLSEVAFIIFLASSVRALVGSIMFWCVVRGHFGARRADGPGGPDLETRSS